MIKPFLIEKIYQYPIDKVWNAITNPEALAKWFVPGKFEAVEGSEYSLANESAKVKGKILKVTKPVLLIYTWIAGDTEVETVVQWKLEKTDDGTKLTIIHEGMEKLEKSYPSLIEKFGQGWTYVVGAIETYLNENE